MATGTKEIRIQPVSAMLIGNPDNPGDYIDYVRGDRTTNPLTGTWSTLPGNSGELSNEAGTLDDTIFGQNYSSIEVGLVGWSISSNALFKGFPGYVATIKITGTPTPMDNIDMSASVDNMNGTWTVTAPPGSDIWHPRREPEITGANAGADIVSIDYLFGKIVYDADPGADVEVDADVITTTTVAGANTLSLTQTAEALDPTTIGSAQDNQGTRLMCYGLKTVSAELSGFYNTSSARFATDLQKREILVLEFIPAGAADDTSGKGSGINVANRTQAVARGFFRLNNQSQSGNVGALEEQSLTFNLYVPDNANLYKPFAWDELNMGTLNPAVKTLLTSWTAGGDDGPGAGYVAVQYLPYGTLSGQEGYEGSAIISEVSLSTGLDAMNELTVNLAGNDQLKRITLS